MPDMSAHDGQLRERERNLVQVRHWTSSLGRHQRSSVAHLRAERDPQLDAGDVERKVMFVVGRKFPQPWHHAKRLQAQFGNCAAQLAHSFHRIHEVDGSYTGETIRPLPRNLRDLIIGEHPTTRTAPGA